jgi:hypothetical protein
MTCSEQVHRAHEKRRDCGHVKKRVLNRFTELMKNAVTAAKKRVLNRFTELMKNAVTAATLKKGNDVF